MTSDSIQRQRKLKALYQRRYKAKNPWAKHYFTTKGNSITNGYQHELRVEDFKELWFRDKAMELKRPSVDRIDPSKGYIKENCRFMELSENVSRAQKGIPKEYRNQTKLTREQVLEIRELYESGKMTKRELSKKFNTVFWNVSIILKRRTWTHI